MKTRAVILDTDWYTDCDDVMAVRILCNLQKAGIFRILGVAINAVFEHSVSSLDGFMQSMGIDVPVAIVPEWTHEKVAKETYQTSLAKLKSKYENNNAAENPVSMYRRLLAETTDKVDILSIGFTENLAALLKSKADEYSPLTGIELIRGKVGELWIMAGRWDMPEGKEYNFRGANAISKVIMESGSIICKEWPTQMTFLGFEVGKPVISGAYLPECDPLKQAMVAHGSQNGRSSWDPLLVLLAAAGTPALASFDEVRGYASSTHDGGINTFVPDANGPHRYVVKTMPDAYYSAWVDSWLER